ncbi:MAG: helix-hairpin-helix domain-containing protein [Bacteroidetes bacterium]|nr:helix-hairpin-helix domain-containing protein [Bacteroidota bacterium]
MKNFLRQYFTFNNRERNGIIVLLSIIVLLIVSIQLVPFLVKPPPIDFNYVQGQIKQLQNVHAGDTSEPQLALSSLEMDGAVVSEKKEQLFNFNPNTVTPDELKQLGFSSRLIHTILNYRNKGGHFYKKEDLKKIYGLKENLYQKLELYIILDSAKQTSPLLVERSPGGEAELNTADSISLVKLRGVGPSFAHRIISYRKKLGGFYKMEQLREVYGLDSSMYALVSQQLELNPQQLARININTANVDQLKKHPYIKSNIANLIVNYRDQHEAYENVDDIKKLRLVTDELYLKLAPYLTTK